MAKKDKDKEPKVKKPRFQRIKQIFEAYRITREIDRWVGVITLGVFVGTLAIVIAIGAALGFLIEGILLAIPTAILAALFIFGRRLEKARYSQVEGQPGAAAAVLESLRRGWTVTPVVQANKNQDLVHRAVGRPGVVLVGEGNPNRVRVLLTAERRFIARVAADVPIHEYVIGDGEGQLPLRKLQKTVMKLPRSLKPKQVTAVRNRLKALGDAKDRLPLPKGPLPKSARAARGRQR
jgi:hypothetical protein